MSARRAGLAVLLAAFPIGTGALAAAAQTASTVSKRSRVCTGSDNAHNRTIGGALLGAIGLGIGAVMDTRHKRRTPRYARTVRPLAPAVSFAPSLGVAAARPLVTAAW